MPLDSLWTDQSICFYARVSIREQGGGAEGQHYLIISTLSEYWSGLETCCEYAVNSSQHGERGVRRMRAGRIIVADGLIIVACWL